MRTVEMPKYRFICSDPKLAAASEAARAQHPTECPEYYHTLATLLGEIAADPELSDPESRRYQELADGRRKVATDLATYLDKQEADKRALAIPRIGQLATVSALDRRHTAAA